MWGELGTRLEGRIVVLEPLREEHVEALWEVARDERIWEWMPIQSPSRSAFEAAHRSALDAAARGEEAPFATTDARTGSVLGSSRYLALRPEHRGLEIGWTWVAAAAWGTGANIEAKLLMLAHAFERLGCMRVEFKTEARNDRARRALEALPARFEGIFRKHMVRPYGVRDSAYYSIVDEEWPDVKARLEARVAAKLAGPPA